MSKRRRVRRSEKTKTESIEMAEIVNSDTALAENVEPESLKIESQQIIPPVAAKSRLAIKSGNTKNMAKLFNQPDFPKVRSSYAHPVNTSWEQTPPPPKTQNVITNKANSSCSVSSHVSSRRSSRSNREQAAAESDSHNRLRAMLKSIRQQRLLTPKKLRKYLAHLDKLAYLIIAYFILTIQSKMLLVAIATLLFKHAQRNIL